jgi:hypothetical protein
MVRPTRQEVMNLEMHSKRPRWPMLAVAAVAVFVVLIAAVAMTAIGGSVATADTPRSSQLQTQSVQDSQATPAPEQGERPAPGKRGDCPDKGGGRQGAAQPEAQATAPDTSSTTQEF